MRAVLARVDATVSVSQHTLGLWKDTGLDMSRARVASTSVDLARYAPADPTERARRRAEFALGPDEFVILFAGRVAPEKGVDVLVDAFRRVAASTPNARLVVVGSPPEGPEQPDSYAARLHGTAESLPVTWLPRRSDVVPLLHTADVAVVPSRWAEPLSRSILEPLACGVPVVATDVGGSPEVLTGWLSEFLVPPEDPAALANRLLSLRDWRRRDPGLGDRCRRAAEARMSLDDELDVIEGAMSDALRARAARVGPER
jgi:glycosyltransferase involved in cell wall biosynthesis